MAVPRLDPRMMQDRVLPYVEYRNISPSFKRRKPSSKLGRVVSLFDQRRTAVRLLPYKLALGTGLLALVAAVALLAYLDADTTRLSYAEQHYARQLGNLGQSMNEAQGQNEQLEGQVITAAGQAPAGVVYPPDTAFLVMTNIPQASGRDLVEKLYPLSRRVICVQP